MKSKTTTNQHHLGGGWMTHLRQLHKIKDWRVLLFATLALIAGVVNLVKVLMFKNYAQLYIPIIWIIISVLIYFIGIKVFYYIFLLNCILIVFTAQEKGYSDIGIFLLMMFVVSKNTKQIIISSCIVICSSIISCAVFDVNMINIFAIIIQFAFALFCYYGFIILRTKDIDHCSKIICTPEERELIHALATQDKSQKEIAYELGMDYQDVTNILRRIRVKNKINTTDMLLRLYAIELSRQE